MLGWERRKFPHQNALAVSLGTPSKTFWGLPCSPILRKPSCPTCSCYFLALGGFEVGLQPLPLFMLHFCPGEQVGVARGQQRAGDVWGLVVPGCKDSGSHHFQTWQLGHRSPLEKALTLLDGEQSAFCGLFAEPFPGLEKCIAAAEYQRLLWCGWGGLGRDDDPLGLGDGERSEFPLRELMSIPMTNPGTLTIARVLRPRDR